MVSDEKKFGLYECYWLVYVTSIHGGKFLSNGEYIEHPMKARQ